MTAATETVFAGPEKRMGGVVRIAAAVYVTVAIGYFVATRFGLPFNADVTYVLDQGALIVAVILATDGWARGHRPQQLFGSLSLVLLLLWSFTDFATTVARMPGEIQSAKVQAQAVCEESRNTVPNARP